MAFVKRWLFFLAMGTMSVVLAGCYGVADRQHVGRHRTPPPDVGHGEPIAGLQTASAQSPD